MNDELVSAPPQRLSSKRKLDPIDRAETIGGATGPRKRFDSRIRAAIRDRDWERVRALYERYGAYLELMDTAS